MGFACCLADAKRSRLPFLGLLWTQSLYRMESLQPELCMVTFTHCFSITLSGACVLDAPGAIHAGCIQLAYDRYH